MDIDYIEKPKHNNIKRKNNYYYICEMKEHTTDKCGFNQHIREHRRISALNHNRKSNKRDKRRKYISNVELSEDYSSDVDTKENTYFDEIKLLFEKQVCNNESTSQLKNEYKNLCNRNSSVNLITKEIDNSDNNSNNDIILWTYGTERSEHIVTNAF